MSGPVGELERSVAARLARAGVDPQRAAGQLRRAGWWSDDGPDELGALVLELVSGVADPSDALATVTDLATAHPQVGGELLEDPAWLRRVVSLGGTSRPLGDLLARHPEAARSLAAPQVTTVVEVARQVEQAVRDRTADADRAAAIAAIRRAVTAGIAARDLCGELAVDAVATELAALAEGVLSGTLAGLHGGERARIAVIGMGKLGGRELNYVSDVDVVFVHAPRDGVEERDAADEARAVLQRLLELLNASTTMGRAYEIDPTLRPEGRSGPLSRTVESFVAYWERWAETWEFQALLKARPVAGDHELGTELLARAEPFVWPDRLDPGVVAEIRAMKSRVEAKPEVRRHGQRQVKLGPGGLRDIEFAVQLLQLVHGRADHELRVPGTLPALDALAAGGYVDDQDAATFAKAYRELRTVEHRLQLAHERRTHTIPDDEQRQEWLARSLGYRPSVEQPARVAFLAHLRAVQADVRDLHAKLFYRPLLEVHAAVAARDADLGLPTAVRAMGEEAAHDRLLALGFRDARSALAHVRALTSGVSRRARTMRAVLPALLQVLAEGADPDVGLRMLRTLVESRGSTATELLGHLRDHPPSAELLARVLATSEVAGELLVGQPQGVEWLRGDLQEAVRDRGELVELARSRLRWQDPSAALRRFKRHELLRIVLRDLGGVARVGLIGDELAALGEACLEAGLEASLAAVAADEGVDELPIRMAVIGMGKLGGRELHYVSDLDVMFVHEPLDTSDAEAGRLAIRVAERLLRELSAITPEGTAFEVDAELRPEGRKGPLCRSLSAYAAYYERWSQPWEHQALVKARPVAGDAELGKDFLELATPLAYPERFGPADAAAMRKMKARIESERLPKRVDPRRHLKLGPGGLTDVEWTVQLLQRTHGYRVPLVRTPTTMLALDALQDAGLVDTRATAWLREGYRFLSEVRNRLYLVRLRSVDVLPEAADTTERLARSLGYGRGGWQAFEDDYKRHTRHVRRVTERVFYGAEPTRR